MLDVGEGELPDDGAAECVDEGDSGDCEADGREVGKVECDGDDCRVEVGEKPDDEPVHWLTVLEATSQPNGVVLTLRAVPTPLLLLFGVMVAAVAVNKDDWEVPGPKAVHEVRGSVSYDPIKFGTVAPFTADAGLDS